MLLLVLLGYLLTVAGDSLLITLDWADPVAGRRAGLAPPTAQAHAQIIQLRGEGLWSLCRQYRLHVQLGVCSNYFVECRDGGRVAVVRTCPFKSFVFMNGYCQPANKFDECRDRALNQINEETKLLVEEEAFCANGAGIYRQMGDDCSRQALICHPNRRDAISITCPAGQKLTEDLQCVPAPIQCPYGVDVTAPIREFFMYRACQGGLDLYRPSKDAGRKPQGMQCSTWYVMCKPRPFMIHCQPGEIYDRLLQKCRKWSNGDVCAMAGVCKGKEWRSVAIGKCKRQFIYCEGSLARLYACKAGMVFDGRDCAPKEAVKGCTLCRIHDRRPGSSCSQYYECERSQHGPHWVKKDCTHGSAFNDRQKTCQQEYTCVINKPCVPGMSFSINCRDYMYCNGDHYEMFSCPPNTRWDAKSRLCVEDYNCQSSNYRKPKQCIAGDTIPSNDCVTYQICAKGKYITAQCKDKVGHHAVPCSHCHPSQERYSVDQLTYPGRCSAGERKHHAHDCAAYYVCEKGTWTYKRCDYEGQVFEVASMTCRNGDSKRCSSYTLVQCRDGERLIDNSVTSNCDRRVTECRGGKWVDIECPNGYIFDDTAYNCKRGTCTSHQQYPNPVPPPQAPGHVPADSYGTHEAGKPAAPPAAHPSNYEVGEHDRFGDQWLNTVPSYVAQSCHGNMRIADQYDCSRFWNCGSSGKFESKVCPPGSIYDHHVQDCKKGSCTVSKCEDGSFQPTEDCGHYKTCFGGYWIEARCDHGKQFINGKCSHEQCVKQNFGEEHYSLMQCQSGAVRPHPSNNKCYMFCHYGTWTERTCPEGAVFDWKVLGCITASQHSPTYQPTCYEGDTRPIHGECSLYEKCQRGQWLKKACPYGFKFYNGMCIVGRCSSVSSQRCRESSGVDGYRRVDEDCSKYYQCVHGKWLERPCAPGTVFNERLSVCDHAANVPECGGY